MTKRRFIQCDVFTATPTKGNGLAVVVDGAGLSDAQMQGFAQWTNLAETTFLMPPSHQDADYKVRIFTTVREMPFAGHPTLGSAMAWLHSGGVPKSTGVLRQECNIGIVEVHLDAGRPAFVAPPTQIREMESETKRCICSALDIRSEHILRCAELDNGPIWQAFELDCAARVLDLDASRVRYPELISLGFIGAHEGAQSAAFEVRQLDFETRMLAPSSGMIEDPITGSLNAALAHWLQSQNRLSRPLTVAQGTKIGRQGRVRIMPQLSGEIHIGGDVHIVIDGSVTL